MPTVTIKRNDTSLLFTDTLLTNGIAVDLTGASVIFLIKRKGDNTSAFSAAATITDAPSGQVEYGGPLPGGFPTAAGIYAHEWEVTFSDSSILTFPSDGNNTVIIDPDLGP